MQKSRAIASARAFLSCPTFGVIVDILKLETKDDWHFWNDPEGNRLTISKKAHVNVYQAATNSTNTKDIFRKATPDIIAKNSYWCLEVIAGQNKILNLLGNEGILRSCYFEDNVWKYNLSPLLLGYDLLRYISSGYLENDYRLIKSVKITYPKGFNIEESCAFGYNSEDDKRIKCRVKNQSLVG
jgi:hypothetical protein